MHNNSPKRTLVKTCLFKLSIATLALSACKVPNNLASDSSGSNDTVTTKKSYAVTRLFSENWIQPPLTPTTAPHMELTAFTYDPHSDNLFFIKATHNSTNNEIHRFNFASGQVSTVFSFPAQWSYGARILDGELYIARSYDNTILRLNNLTANTLNQQGNYGGTGIDAINNGSAEFNNVNDFGLANGNLYFVLGNFTVSPKNNGIQYVQLPNYTSVFNFLTSTDSHWQVPGGIFSTRSIVATGSGSSTKFAISTGITTANSQGVMAPQNIEIRDSNSNLLSSVTTSTYNGLQYLQVDSLGRLYTITNNCPGSVITRWSSNLADKEEFKLSLDFSTINGGIGVLFALREGNHEIQVVMAPFRYTNADFYSTIIPD